MVRMNRFVKAIFDYIKDLYFRESEKLSDIKEIDKEIKRLEREKGRRLNETEFDLKLPVFLIGTGIVAIKHRDLIINALHAWIMSECVTDFDGSKLRFKDKKELDKWFDSKSQLEQDRYKDYWAKIDEEEQFRWAMIR